MTPRTSRPAARAASAMRPASSGGQPQRGRPTSTSTNTSRTPARAAACTVSSESTATVTRASSSAIARRRCGSSGLVGEEEVVGEARVRQPDRARAVSRRRSRCVRARAGGGRARCTCAPSRAGATGGPAAPPPSSRGCARAPPRRPRARAWAGRRPAWRATMARVSPVSAEDRPPVTTDYHTDDLPATPTRDFLIPATRWVEAPAALLDARSRLRRRAGRVQAPHQPLPALARRPGARLPTPATWRSRPTTSGSSTRSASSPTARHRHRPRRRRADPVPHLEGSPPRRLRRGRSPVLGPAFVAHAQPTQDQGSPWPAGGTAAGRRG